MILGVVLLAVVLSRALALASGVTSLNYVLLMLGSRVSTSRRYSQGSMLLRRQASMMVNMIALLSQALASPINNPFFLPTAVGRMAFSTWLLSICFAPPLGARRCAVACGWLPHPSVLRAHLPDHQQLRHHTTTRRAGLVAPGSIAWLRRRRAVIELRQQPLQAIQIIQQTLLGVFIRVIENAPKPLYPLARRMRSVFKSSVPHAQRKNLSPVCLPLEVHAIEIKTQQVWQQFRQHCGEPAQVAVGVVQIVNDAPRC